jgi:prepilin-type N-terminal cleavage/methylation domain-containing protein
MTRHSLQSAVRAGRPFVINTADGKSQEARQSWKIAVGPTSRRLRRRDRGLFPRLTSDFRLLRSAERGPESVRGFTLIELLIVLGIVAMLMLLMAPAFTTIKSSGDVTSAAYTVKAVLDTARTYAKANNTYTWVGFCEEDVSSTTSGCGGTGRIVMSIVASKDGTNVATGRTISSTALLQVGKLTKIDNVHLTTFYDLASPPRGAYPANTFDYRPLVTVSGTQYTIGDTTDTIPPDTGTLFQYPAGSPYPFPRAIQFSPSGLAQMINSTTTYPTQPAAEIGLSQTHGNSPPTLVLNNGTYVGNMVAVQVTGVAGSVTVYRK